MKKFRQSTDDKNTRKIWETSGQCQKSGDWWAAWKTAEGLATGIQWVDQNMFLGTIQ